MVGPIAVLAPTTPAPPPAEEGSYFQRSCSRPSPDGRPRTMKTRAAPWSAAAKLPAVEYEQTAATGAAALHGAGTKIPISPDSECGSADPWFWGPRFFRRATDKPRTPTPGVRATWLAPGAPAYRCFSSRFSSCLASLWCSSFTAFPALASDRSCGERRSSSWCSAGRGAAREKR